MLVTKQFESEVEKEFKDLYNNKMKDLLIFGEYTITPKEQIVLDNYAREISLETYKKYNPNTYFHPGWDYTKYPQVYLPYKFN